MGRWMISLKCNMAVYLFSGYSLSGKSLPENELAPYIQQAIDQVGSHFDLWHLVLTATNSFRWISWLETLLKAKLVHLFLLSSNLYLHFLSCTTSIARSSKTIHIKLCWSREWRFIRCILVSISPVFFWSFISWLGYSDTFTGGKNLSLLCRKNFLISVCAGNSGFYKLTACRFYRYFRTLQSYIVTKANSLRCSCLPISKWAIMKFWN